MIEIPACKVDFYSDRVTLMIPADRRPEIQLLEQRLSRKRVVQVYVKLAEVKVPRSTGKHSANTHIHGHATQIANFVGESKSKIILDAVDMAMGRLGQEFPTHVDYKGDRVADSESNWDSRTAHHVIEALHQIGTMVGVKLIEDKED